MTPCPPAISKNGKPISAYPPRDSGPKNETLLEKRLFGGGIVLQSEDWGPIFFFKVSVSMYSVVLAECADCTCWSYLGICGAVCG